MQPTDELGYVRLGCNTDKTVPRSKRCTVYDTHTHAHARTHTHRPVSEELSV